MNVSPFARLANDLAVMHLTPSQKGAVYIRCLLACLQETDSPADALAAADLVFAETELRDSFSSTK
jgi:hypothetical protein